MGLGSGSKASGRHCRIEGRRGLYGTWLWSWDDHLMGGDARDGVGTESAYGADSASD